MNERFIQIIGIIAVALLSVGASLYAINFSSFVITRTLLIAGGTLLVLFVAINIRVIIGFFRRRSSRYGANMVVMTLLFISIVVVLQTLSARHSYRVDLTSNQRFSLAEQTINILVGLDKDVRLYGFYKHSDGDRAYAEYLFDQLAHESDHVRYELIDPDRSPTRATEMGVTDYGMIVVEYGDKSEKITAIGEETLTNAILKLTRDEQKKVCFVVGHGEKTPDKSGSDGYSIMRDALRTQNYLVSTISLLDVPVVPEECDLVIIGGPTSDYFEAEITKLANYLAQGKNAVFLLDPRVDVPNLENLLVRYRVLLEANVVIDPYSRIFGAEYTVPVVTQYVEHPITEGIDQATIYPLARSVRIAGAGVPGVSVQYLAQTGESAWGETDLGLIDDGQAVRSDDDTTGPVSIGLISVKKYRDGIPDSMGPDESQIVVFGDSDFADNSTFRLSGNGDLMLNIVNYLAEEKDLIAIRPKQALGDRLLLTAAQGRQIFFISVVLLPLSVMVFGVSVFVQRRKQG